MPVFTVCKQGFQSAFQIQQYPVDLALDVAMPLSKDQDKYCQQYLDVRLRNLPHCQQSCCVMLMALWVGLSERYPKGLLSNLIVACAT